MKSRTTERFRTAFDGLPGKVQERARASYRLFAENPYHPSLRFKQVHPTRPIFSVRAGLAYRALGVRYDDALSVRKRGPIGFQIHSGKSIVE